MPKKSSERFIELDILRGFAISYMILLHILWDLDYFKIVKLDMTIYQTNIIVQVMFFTLLGVCLAISYDKNKNRSKKKVYLHLIDRGCWVFILGMILTIITALFMPERPILFGVLHCIGFCIILSIPFLKLKHWNLPIATIMIVLGVILGSYNVSNPTALHLLIGLRPIDFWTNTIDYFPIFPWVGVCLLGVAMGSVLYKDKKRKFIMPDLTKYKPARFLSWLGQHSLIIYLAHQPVITGVLVLYLFF